MARGKFAARAANRIVTAEVTTTIEDYKRAVVRLTQERDHARCDLHAQNVKYQEEVQELRRMVADAVSPELQARDMLIESLREKLGSVRSDLSGLKEKHERAFNAFLKILVGAGLEVPEVYELLLQEVQIDAGRDPENLTIVVTPDFIPGAGSKLGKEAIARIQAARGLRRKA